MCVCVCVCVCVLDRAHVVIGIEHTGDVFSKVTVKNSLDVVTMVNCNTIKYTTNKSLSLSLSLFLSLSLSPSLSHTQYNAKYTVYYAYVERHTVSNSQ